MVMFNIGDHNSQILKVGFGHGKSLIICAGILTGYSYTLYKMLARLSGSGVNWVPYVVVLLGFFLDLLPCGQYWPLKDAGRSSCSIMPSSQHQLSERVFHFQRLNLTFLPISIQQECNPSLRQYMFWLCLESWKAF